MPTTGRRPHVPALAMAVKITPISTMTDMRAAGLCHLDRSHGRQRNAHGKQTVTTGKGQDKSGSSKEPQARDQRSPPAAGQGREKPHGKACRRRHAARTADRA